MDTVFSGLSLIIVIGAVVAIIMRRIGQPLMIGHILTGIVVGPALLHVAKDPAILNIFSDLGIALLLFIIGLGMNPRVVREVGKASLTVGVAQVALTTLMGTLVCMAILGMSFRQASFLGFGFAISSTIVALKLLSDKKEQGRLYGKLTIGASLVEDILSVVALIFVASAQDGAWLSLGPFAGLVIKGLAIGFIMYFVTNYLLPQTERFIAGDQELLFLFAIAWGLGSAALLAKAGFSLEVGALAAGVFLAPLPYAQEIASRLRPLRDFFVIVFFIALGAGLTFNNFGNLILPILVGLFVVTIFKPFTILTGLGLLGYTKRTSFKTAITLTQVSEFSIIFVILGVHQGLIPQRIVTILTFIALISIAASTYLVTFSDQIYQHFEKYLDMFERRKTHTEALPAKRYELVLFGYQKGGHEFLRVFKQISKNFVVVDYDPEVIDILEHRKVNYLYGDATDPELLEEAGVEHAKLVVSAVTDFEVNKFLLDYLKHKESEAVIIVQADSPNQATNLYENGASYVILPHYIGSEKISAFVKSSGLKKREFRKMRSKHLEYLDEEYKVLEKMAEHDKKLGHAILKNLSPLTKVKG